MATRMWNLPITITDFKDVKNLGQTDILGMVNQLSLAKRAALSIHGYTEIGKYRLSGWKEEIPLYLVSCEKHGYQITHASGHYQMLLCPKCIEESSQIK